MLVPFESLPSSSRVWVYQSDRTLTEAQKNIISQTLSSFCDNWMTHGTPMKASFDIRYDHFIIVAADEQFNAASGCSIDDSVRVFKALQEKLKINLLERNHVAFKLSDHHVEIVPLHLLKQKSREGFWNQNTLMFNNLITKKVQLEEAWIVHAGSSWLKRYLSKETAVS